MLIIKTTIIVILSYLGLKALISNWPLDHKKSDHFNGRKFFNPNHQDKKGYFTFLKWQFSRKPSKWPEFINDNAIPQIANDLKEGEISTSFINHISHLIQINGYNFLTDPQFSMRTSPIQFIGPKRHRKPGIEFDNLPKIDFVLISHNHYDHMDKDSIRKLAKKFNPTFIVPLGNKKNLEKFGAKNIIELDWWQNYQIKNEKVQVTVVPAQHWSKRTLFDVNKALWGGFVIESYGKKIYFAGDTGYGDFYKKIFEKFGIIDLSFLPIGAYEPRWFMKNSHMNPEDAVLAHLDLKSKKSIGTHFGTFQLTDEGIDDPIKDLEIAKEKNKIAKNDFVALKNGESLKINN